MEELLLISLQGTPYNLSTFPQCYLGVTETEETGLKIGECEVHECNMSTTIWKNYLNPLTIKTKYFNGYTIIYQKSTMNRLSKGNSIWSSVVNNKMLYIKNKGD